MSVLSAAYRPLLPPPRRPPWKWLLGGVALLLLVGGLLYPQVGGWLAARTVARRLSARLGIPVTIGQGRAAWGSVRLSGWTIGERQQSGKSAYEPLAVIEWVDAPLSAYWGKGTVVIHRPQVTVRRGGPTDNVTQLSRRMGKPEGADTTSGGSTGLSRPLPEVLVVDGSLQAQDSRLGQVTVGVVSAHLVPGKQLTVEFRQISGVLRIHGGAHDPVFGAGKVDLSAPLSPLSSLRGLRPTGFPYTQVEEGFIRLLPTLPLTGITGSARGESSRPGSPIAITLTGSYAGARRALWTAKGSFTPQHEGEPPAGHLDLQAERFTLDKIADVVPGSVLHPASTSVDASLRATLADNQVTFAGNFGVGNLGLQHEALARDPVDHLTFGLAMTGAVDLLRRRLDLTQFEGRLGSLVGQLSGSIELGRGVFKFHDGTELDMVPRIELGLHIPKMSCAKLLTSVPSPLVPRLQGFELQGQFGADIHTKIDYADLDDLSLEAKVGIDGCKVLKAPDEVLALAGPESIVQMVDVPTGPEVDPLATESLVFALGPDNPNFVPYDQVSPHLVNAIMTTEDSGFFKHRGWVTPTFKTALARNLAGGGFRLGASSITMQMVKNVLLSQEKTLSRKLQELFLVWYIEQQLPKERILELYLNAIEFGPRIYGIGAAARHYFGKTAAELNPLEAAFFSSILPSPKRRYIQYCHGALFPPWDKYVRRILTRVHERGRLTDEEYEAVAAAPLAFDLTARPESEKVCLEWIKRMTQKPDSEVPAEAESP